MYIKLPMYLFFYTALGLNDFHAGYWKGWAMKISTSRLRSLLFPGPKKSRFSGPTIITSRAI
jgi:hypothetical protein